MSFSKAIKLKDNCKISNIRSDQNTEFENSQIESFCVEMESITVFLYQESLAK